MTFGVTRGLARCRSRWSLTFTPHYGPPNDVCLAGAYPKLTELQLGYSRDGFHWSRQRTDM